MDKAPDAFRTISEVAEDLDLPQHVLRFWETRFTQIRPMKRGGGRRYYRPDDVELLRGIRHLLYGEGYTIKGVQRILKEQGVRFVMDIWRNPGMPIPSEKGKGARVSAEVRAPAAEVGAFATRDVGEIAGMGHDLGHDRGHDLDTHGMALGAGQIANGSHAQGAESGDVLTVDADGPLPAGILADESAPRGAFRFMDRFRGGADTQPQGGGALSRDDIRRLQSTLFELLECKRLLDQTR